MPKLEGQESSILPAEEPPNYDQSEYEEKESQLQGLTLNYSDSHQNLSLLNPSKMELTEKAVDFTKDRSPAAREEIATRCGAEKIFVPNRWGTKTSVRGH